jgi:hypothetical protein
MKKALLIVAMLLVVSPVMASVTITAVNEGTYLTTGLPGDANRSAHIRIGYTTTGIAIRAFALDVNVDSGCTFGNIRDFNVGENNSVKQGYGIFPGRFRQYVSPTNYNWSDSNYNPTPYYNDPGALGTGIGFGEIIAEMGYLGAPNIVGGIDTNAPPASGTLFRVDVNAYAYSGTATVTITPDTMRGGVVDVCTNAATTNMPVTLGIYFPPGCVTPLPEVGNAKATAETAWTGQGFTLCGTGVVNCAKVGLIISQDSGCYTLPYCIQYTYGINSTVPNVVNQLEATATANITAAGLTLGVRTTTCSNTIAAGYVISTNPVAGTSYCGAVAYVVSTGPCDCFPSSDPAYSDWVSFGKPACWCNLRQCHGDADGLAQGTAKAGFYYVGTNDLAVLLAAWQVLEPPKGPGIATITVNGIPGICADFAHDAQGTAKAGIYRVGTNDLSRMLTYWQVLESPKGTGTPADCPHN